MFNKVFKNIKKVVKEGVINSVKNRKQETKPQKSGFVEKEIKANVCKHMDTAPKAEEIKDSVQYDDESLETNHSKSLKILLTLRVFNAIAAFVWAYILVNTASLIIGVVSLALLISVIYSLIHFTKLSRKISNRFSTSF